MSKISSEKLRSLAQGAFHSTAVRIGRTRAVVLISAAQGGAAACSGGAPGSAHVQADEPIASPLIAVDVRGTHRCCEVHDHGGG